MTKKYLVTDLKNEFIDHMKGIYWGKDDVGYQLPVNEQAVEYCAHWWSLKLQDILLDKISSKRLTKKALIEDLESRMFVNVAREDRADRGYNQGLREAVRVIKSYL